MGENSEGGKEEVASDEAKPGPHAIIPKTPQKTHKEAEESGSGLSSVVLSFPGELRGATV